MANKQAQPITGILTLTINGKVHNWNLSYNGTNESGKWHYVVVPDMRKDKTTFPQTIRVPDTLVNPDKPATAKPEAKNGDAKTVNPADDPRIARLEVAVENTQKAILDLIAKIAPPAPAKVDQTVNAHTPPAQEAKKS